MEVSTVLHLVRVWLCGHHVMSAGEQKFLTVWGSAVLNILLAEIVCHLNVHQRRVHFMLAHLHANLRVSGWVSIKLVNLEIFLPPCIRIEMITSTVSA